MNIQDEGWVLFCSGNSLAVNQYIKVLQRNDVFDEEKWSIIFANGSVMLISFCIYLNF